MNKFSVKFRASKEDYYEADHYFRMAQNSHSLDKIILWFFLAITILLIVFKSYVIALIVFIITVFLWRNEHKKWIVRKNISSLPQYNKEEMITFDNDQITYSINNEEISQFPFTELAEALETPNLFLIYYADYSAYMIIPKRSFLTIDDQNSFRALLSNQFDQPL